MKTQIKKRKEKEKGNTQAKKHKKIVLTCKAREKLEVKGRERASQITANRKMKMK